MEKGDKVKEGQVLVRLEDEEFRAQYEQAKGAAENARAYLEELEHGSRPEEIQEAQHNLDEARATLVNDKLPWTAPKIFRRGCGFQTDVGRCHRKIRFRSAASEFAG